MDAATSALDMPYEPAESLELGTAPREHGGTAVDTLIVHRTVQVQIEGRQSFECFVANEALILIAIKRTLRCVRLNHWGCEGAIGCRNRVAWACNDMTTVELCGDRVNILSVHLGTAGTRLEVHGDI